MEEDELRNRTASGRTATGPPLPHNFRLANSALLIDNEVGMLAGLASALSSLPLASVQAQSLSEAASWLQQQSPPEIVFAATAFREGGWRDVVQLAGALRCPVPIVVVLPEPDAGLEIDVLEGGAFDFIVPPFDADALDCLVRGAMWKTEHRCDRSSAQAA